MTRFDVSVKAADLAARATVPQIRDKLRAGIFSHEVASQAIKLRERVDRTTASPAAPRAKLAAVAAFLEHALPAALTAREIARKARQDVARPGYEAALAELAAKAVKAAKKGNRGRAR